jgi:hypothetical protein
VLVVWRCSGLDPKTDFSGGREEGCRKGGPTPLEDEVSRGWQSGRGGGQRPHSLLGPGLGSCRTQSAFITEKMS